MLTAIDGILFVVAAAAVAWLAVLVVLQGLHLDWRLVLIVLFWIMVAYLMLPRFHRVLTRIYVPNYFFGRARTSDGLLGDPINLGLLGTEDQIHEAMEAAEWIRADDLSLRSGLGIVRSTLSRRSYARAPVSPLLLFDRQQDFAYQQEVAGNPAKRHHVRFWRCPDGWLLPGGFRVDYLAAGTYDRAVGFSLFTLQVTHKIEQNTDIERDLIVATVVESVPQARIQTLENFSTGYHARNGGGDLIETDGDLPVIDVRALPSRPPGVIAPTDSRNRRPVQIVFGGGAEVARGIGWVVLAVIGAVAPNALAEVLEVGKSATGEDSLALRIGLVGVLGCSALFDLVIGLAVLSGRQRFRILAMVSSVMTATSILVNSVHGTTITGSILAQLALSILILLALSSHRAREYTAQRATRLALRSARPAAMTTGQPEPPPWS